VEDDKFLSDLLTTNLSKKGYVLCTTEEGEKVLSLADECAPDVMLLDLMLPGINGDEVLAHLKEKEQFKNTPVIIFSNISDKAHIEKVLKLGAVNYLVKASTSLDQLAEEIDKVARGAAPEHV
jgi:DNA-binding response OmpR family regulator